MRIYVAAPFPRKLEVRDIVILLRQHGLVVVSTWADSPHMADSDVSAEFLREACIHNLEEIDDSDTLILINPHGWVKEGNAGKTIEFGYALAKEKRCFVVGELSCAFYNLPQVRHFMGIYELMDWARAEGQIQRQVMSGELRQG